MERRQCLQVVTEATDYYLLGGSTIVSAAEDDAAPEMIIPLILFANWSYTKTAKREIFAHY